MQLLILFAVLVGATSQRVTGMGFALVSGPFLVLFLDPFSGVILVNICSIVSCCLNFGRTWREVDWITLKHLALGAILGAVPGAAIAAFLPVAPLQIVIGMLIVVSLATSLVIGHVGSTIPATFGARLTSGIASGAMSATAGTGGPAISAYAVLTSWEHRTFAATMQPFLIIGAGSSVLFKLLFSSAGWPQLDPIIWIGLAVALVAGLLAGEGLSRKLPISAARAAMIVLALSGGAATMIKGIVHLG